MDYTLILLRLLHIVAAFAWVGAGTSIAFFIMPSARAAGENGLRYLNTLLRHTAITRVFRISAGLTMLAGILLFGLSDVRNHFSTTCNAVLGLGALAGILSGIHWGAFTGRALRSLEAILWEKIPSGNQAMPADDLLALREQTTKVVARARVSVVLTIIALLGMASARYL
ncbi:MAG: hypothetical protein F9K46_00515 [Anaerolineae bacterium]|nr:MAG: hypothetical protein F9K46_00515 [Anaerolineae bacterium]